MKRKETRSASVSHNSPAEQDSRTVLGRAEVGKGGTVDGTIAVAHLQIMKLQMVKWPVPVTAQNIGNGPGWYNPAVYIGPPYYHFS